MARQPWWPQMLALQIQKVKDIRTKIGGYQAALGLTGGDVAAIENLCLAIEEAQNFRVTTEGTNKAVTEWRDQVFYGTPKGDAVSAAPIYAVKGVVTYTRGSVNQLFDWRDNILTRPGFTDVIGEDIGFLGPDAGGPQAPESVQPTLTLAAAAQGDFEFAAIVGNRGDSDQWILSGAPVGTIDWQQLGVLTGKSGNATWPGGGTIPIQLQCRAQLRLKNDNYGIPSDIVLVTLIP